MRISDRQIVATREYQINSAYENLARAENVVSTDRNVNSPADDPYGTSIALRLQASEDQNTQFSSTASDTLAWLQSTTSALEGVNSALTQARALAVQGGDGTLTTDEMQTLATQVGQLVQEGIQSANTDYAGRYVLSGFQTSTVPFSLNTSTNSVDYSGDNGAIVREVSPGVTMQINTPGSTAVPAAFAAMIQLETDLQSGNTSSVTGADLTAIDSASSGILVAQASVGAATTRVTALQTTLSTQLSALKDQYSNIVDADLAQASITYTSDQATYQAALTVAGKSVEPSLLSFLQ